MLPKVLIVPFMELKVVFDKNPLIPKPVLIVPFMELKAEYGDFQLERLGVLIVPFMELKDVNVRIAFKCCLS